MISIEIILILIWALLLFVSLMKRTAANTSLLISGFVVGTLFIWLDNTQGQITYTTHINFPIINYPIAIICLAALYFFSIARLGQYINNIFLSKLSNHYVSGATMFIIIAFLNILYPIVDFTIVNMQGGIFTNNHINQFYESFKYNSDIQQYQFFAFIFFLLAIYLSILIGKVFNKLYFIITNKSEN
ncbi:MAG TPA: hypothetical protein PLO05_06350 [Bacteroidales bacterium]|nr:hypothetical protein [Bacteroidales bacterium]HXK81758.1 hypothetical protein [Bacteroidales bacterium]